MVRPTPWTVAVLALTVAGCATPVGVRRVGGDAAFEQVTANALLYGVPSHFSREVLARSDLLDLFRSRPSAAIDELHTIACEEPDRDRLFALTEVSYLTARKERSRARYLASVVYAFLYLFSEASQGVADPYDPRFRLVCDLYNRSLGEFLKSPNGDIVLEDAVHKLPFGSMEVRASRPGFPWGPEEFKRFLPAAEFEVRGLRGRNRNAGLGVPLIALRTLLERKRRPDDFLPPRAAASATALLRVDGGLRGLRLGRFTGSLELFASFQVAEVEVAGRKVPLEADLTAHMAYGLQTSGIFDFELTGFFSAEKAKWELGLFMTQPYLPGKIPVVFVHGTASSPARWAEMFNTLNSDRKLREEYQYWFFMYSTGNPIAYSADLLREALRRAVATVDPGGTDPALRQMVIVGHSQGGILTRLQTIDAGTRFWDAVSSKKFEELDLSPEARKVISGALFFKSVPFVRRVIFVATPHGGSFLANHWMGRLAATFVSLPRNVARFGPELFVKNEAALLKGVSREVPTSIKNMDPANPFLNALKATPIPEQVKAHSIIAVKGDGPPQEGNDGVVEYTSAHIEGVASEFVVHSSHSCQSHPLTIVEVQRILHEHLAESKRTPATPEAAASNKASGGR